MIEVLIRYLFIEVVKTFLILVTRVEQSNRVTGILANGGLFHTPEWGTEGGTPTNFAIDSVKYDYVKNNTVYDTVTEGNVRYYQSVKLLMNLL